MKSGLNNNDNDTIFIKHTSS